MSSAAKILEAAKAPADSLTPRFKKRPSAPELAAGR